MRMVVRTELYARAVLCGSDSITWCTVAGPLSQSTSIRRSSASVKVGDFLGGKLSVPSLCASVIRCLLRRASSSNVTNYLVIRNRATCGSAFDARSQLDGKNSVDLYVNDN